MVSRAPTEIRVHRAVSAPSVHRVHLDLPDHRDHRAATVFQAQWEIPEPPGSQVAQDHRAHKAHKDHPVVLAELVLQDQPEILDQLGHPE